MPQKQPPARTATSRLFVEGSVLDGEALTGAPSFCAAAGTGAATAIDSAARASQAGWSRRRALAWTRSFMALSLVPDGPSRTS